MPKDFAPQQEHLAAPPPSNPLLDEALRYADDGWPVLPLRPRGKRPLTAHGFKDATTNPERVKSWWQRWPQANIGLSIPSDYIVVDIDSADALQVLKAEDLTLPTTVTSATSRGQHLWYSTTVPVKNRPLIEGIDIKTDGGYVVVPPSVHPSGATYTWTTPLDRSAISEAPDWLCDKLSSCRRSVIATHSGESWWNTILDPIDEGSRNQTLTRLCGHFFSYLPPESAAAVSILWATTQCEPPLSFSEITSTLESIAGRELQSRRNSP